MDINQHYYFNAGAPMAGTTSTTVPPPPPPAERKRRRQQITDDDDVEVIALSAEELNAKNLFLCELCNKSFNREQNLLIHLRAHNLPYVRKNRPVENNDDEKRKVYVCPETTCTFHWRPNALSDLPSLKKHFKRKHGEKTMTCTNCLRKYAVEGDLRAHMKICGTKDNNCECGSVFSRYDSYMAHKKRCDSALALELSLLRNEFETSQTTVGRLFVPGTFDHASISYPNNQPALINSRTTTSIQSFPLLNHIIQAPPIPNLSTSNQSVHCHMMTIDPANDSSIQGGELNDNIFDVNVLHDRLFGVSSVPATVSPHEAPQQGLILTNSGTSGSFLGSLGNSTAANLNVYPNYSSAASGNSYFPVLESVSGTYWNPDQLRYQGNNICGNVFNLRDEAMQRSDPLVGDYRIGTLNESIFNTNLENEAHQNGIQSGFSVDQINVNQQEQWHGRRVGRDANFPVLQNDFHFWENNGN